MADTIVITPAYCTKENGRLGLLQHTIDSVLIQNYDIIHLVVDDGSPESCEELVRDLATNNPRLRYFRRTRNPNDRKTASNAINIGIEIAFHSLEGALSKEESNNLEYLTIIHSDDILAENSIKDRTSAIKEFDAKMVYSDLAYFNRDGLLRVNRYKNFDDLNKLWKNIWIKGIPYHTMLWTIDLLKEIEARVRDSYCINSGIFYPRIAYGEDRNSALDTVKTVKSPSDIRHIDKVTVFYRVHDDSITGTILDEKRLADLRLIKKTHLSNRQAFLIDLEKFLRKPHSFLPEPIKVYLRPIRNRVKGLVSPNYTEYDLYIKQFI